MDYIDFRRSWPKNAMAVSKSGFDLNCGRVAIRIIVGGCRACTTSYLKLAGWREPNAQTKRGIDGKLTDEDHQGCDVIYVAVYTGRSGYPA